MFCIYLRTNSDLCHLQHKQMVIIIIIIIIIGKKVSDPVTGPVWPRGWVEV